MIAAYKAVKSGYQVAVMAPTAILATQHLEEFQKILEPLGIRCRLLLGATKAKEKKEILELLENGEIDILIGTHSLISDNVNFAKLGLAITDEQHRFGVKQRATISSKGNNPDVLVMTATPIPRTLALIVYGDLDISIIDELPPNRKKIETYAVSKNMEERVNNFIRTNIKEGRQVYVVCPLVEEKEDEEDEQKAELKAVKEWTEKYQKEVVPALMKKFNYKSVMEAPKLEKIVINIGLGDVKDNPKSLENAVNDLTIITGQKPIITKAKKAIAAFKLREGVNVGCKVTLRSRKMYDFAYKLFNVALPRVRDFRGVSNNSFDGRGNYSMGIKEQLIFPEIEYDKIDKIRGMDIIFVTTAKTDEEAKELLSLLGMPFQNN